MSIINKGVLFIRNNLYFAIGCMILFITIILLYQIRAVYVIEGLDPIPRYEYTPSSSSGNNRAFYFSNSNYNPIYLLPYDSDTNVEQFLEKNQNAFNVDVDTGIIYTNGTNNKKYAYGTSNNPLKFQNRSDPMTFLKSIGSFFSSSDTQLPQFIKFVEYENGVITITVKSPYEQPTQTSSTNTARITINDIKKEFKKDGGKYIPGACYIMGQKYDITPWENTSSIPNSLRNFWNGSNDVFVPGAWGRLPYRYNLEDIPEPYKNRIKSNPEGNYCNRIVKFHNSTGMNNHNEYIDKYKKPSQSSTTKQITITITLKDKSLFETKIINALIDEYNTLYVKYTYTPLANVKVTVPDKTIDNYAIEVTNSDGKIDSVNLTSDKILPKLFADMNIGSQIQTKIQEFQDNVQSITSESRVIGNSNYISGYIVFNNIEYPVIVQSPN
jgi:hypothetical protein